MQTAIWWIRRDLRLADNLALTTALEQAAAVIPLFILEPAFEKSAYVGSKRRAFLYAGLQELDAALQQRGSRLIVRRGNPAAVLSELAAAVGAKLIVAESDHSSLARKRDTAVARELPLELVGSTAVQMPGAVLKKDGKPYTVFTPFSRAWKVLPLPNEDDLLPAPENIPPPPHISSMLPPDFLQMMELTLFSAGETAAAARLQAFVQSHVFDYAANRNRMDLAGTSQLSPYLRFGMLSPRAAVVAALRAQAQAADANQRKGAETWLNELIWRDFFIHILAHFPFVNRMSFREAYRNIPWRNDPAEFEAWCNGRTGYPVVDAAMRQLLETGWMHNRARMIVASFLVKDLLIDWRWGERWFMQQLIDGDPAANNGGWQWTAGTGTDAAPYFRIFNPITQSKKFDPDGAYIRHWVPELRAIPASYIHAPWQIPPLEQQRLNFMVGRDYPAPLVDHKAARERTLMAYKAASKVSPN